MNLPKVSVIGIGKLGLPMMAFFADRGRYVIGVDRNVELVNKVTHGIVPWFEKGLDPLLREARDHYHVVSGSAEEIVARTGITFIVVPTPSADDGSFSNKHVLEVAEEIGRGLSRKGPGHLIVLTSTVMPGTTKDVLIPTLERVSGMKCGVDFGVCYNPEFIALGSVVSDLSKPDFILIGESDEKAGEALINFYRELFDSNHPPIARMNLVSAEIAKIAVNSFITMKIAFANSIGTICENTPGADVDLVSMALGLDRRIGKAYLRAGPSFGGPCFPRDNIALLAFAKSLGIGDTLFAETTDRLNKKHLVHSIDRIVSVLNDRDTVAIIGLSYKMGTAVLTESPGVTIVKCLLTAEHRVVVYDPVATEEVKKVFGTSVTYAETLAECLEAATAVIIALPFPKLADIGKMLRPGMVVFDCWRSVDVALLPDGVRYLAIGSHCGM